MNLLQLAQMMTPNAKQTPLTPEPVDVRVGAPFQAMLEQRIANAFQMPLLGLMPMFGLSMPMANLMMGMMPGLGVAPGMMGAMPGILQMLLGGHGLPSIGQVAKPS